MAVRAARQGAVGSRCDRPRWTARIAGSRWRSPGTGCARSACPRSRWPPSPTSFAKGMAARADILGDTGTSAPEHWVGGLAGDDLHAIAILFSRTDDAVPPVHRGARQTARPHRRRAEPVVPRPQRDATVQLRPRPLRLPRPAVAAGDEGFRRGARRRAPAQRWNPASSSSAIPTRTGRSPICPSPRCCRATAATWRTGGCRSMSGLFRDYLRENADTPEEQELLAAKFMGRWRSGAPLVLAPDKDDPELGADPHAQQRLQLQGDGSARLRVPAGITCAPAESARHRAQHEPPPDDPARRDLRSRAARRRARRRRGPRHRRVHHLRQPGAPVRVRAERVDQRQDVPRTRQRARSRSAEPRTAHWTSPFPNARSARCTRECRPSRR